MNLICKIFGHKNIVPVICPRCGEERPAVKARDMWAMPKVNPPKLLPPVTIDSPRLSMPTAIIVIEPPKTADDTELDREINE